MSKVPTADQLRKSEINKNFDFNLNRVDSLISTYSKITAVRPDSRGRKSVRDSDILRAATVLLHATLEDLLRSIAYWRLPNASAEVLDRMSLPGLPGERDRKSRFTMSELATFRGKSVDDVIVDSVNQYLQRSNYNNVEEIIRLLLAVDLPPEIAVPYKSSLDGLMLRRHQIVHRADRTDQSGSGDHRAKSIKESTVTGWVDTVRHFGLALIELL